MILALAGSSGCLFSQVVYVANSSGRNVIAYTINAASGALTAVPGSPFPSVSSFLSGEVAVDPTGKFAYVTTHEGDTVSAYTINAASGALTAVRGSPFKAAFSSTSIALAVHPSGRFVYLPGPPVGNSPTVLAYAIDTT
jgi:6-phosphogluconolactonase